MHHSYAFTEVRAGFEPADNGVADRGLTTWLSHHIKLYASYEASMTPTGIEPVLPP